VVAQSPTTWLYGALAAALTGIILATSLAPGRIKQFNIVTIVCFSALTIAGIGLGAQDQDWMNTYSTTLSSGVLAVVVLGSLLVVPLSEQYARESTPTDLWHQPAFRYRHRLLTLGTGVGRHRGQRARRRHPALDQRLDQLGASDPAAGRHHQVHGNLPAHVARAST